VASLIDAREGQAATLAHSAAVAAGRDVGVAGGGEGGAVAVREREGDGLAAEPFAEIVR